MSSIKSYVQNYPSIVFIFHPNQMEDFTQKELDWLRDNHYTVKEFDLGGSIITNETLKHALQKYIDFDDV